MRRTSFPFLVFCLILALALPAHAERRMALVIGNAAYKSAPLKNPVNDARDMAVALRRLGFEVILRENASLAQMEAAVDEFGQRLKQGGAGLFYFAGHGMQVNGRNYLVPVDALLQAEQDAKYKCLDAGMLLGRMENAGNELNIIILDACRNNPFARSWRSADVGLAKMDAPRGSLIAYATAPDSVAADGTGKNGLYTERLLKAMTVPGLPVERVFKHVRDEVMRATNDKQVPWESTSLRGNFTFAGGAAALSPGSHKAALGAKPPPRVEAGSGGDPYAQLARKDFGEAQNHFEARVNARPDDAEARAGLALAMLMTNREADAKYQVRRAEESGRSSPNTRLARGFLLATEGQFDDSFYQIQRAREDGADKALVQLALATLANKKNNTEQTMKAMEAYHALVPPAEESAYARELTKKSDFVGQLEGSYAWTDTTKQTMSGEPPTIITILRAGDGLSATASSGTISDISLEGKKLTLRWRYTVEGFLGGSMSMQIIADLSGNMDEIPITFRLLVKANPPAHSGYLVRKGGKSG